MDKPCHNDNSMVEIRTVEMQFHTVLLTARSRTTRPPIKQSVSCRDSAGSASQLLCTHSVQSVGTLTSRPHHLATLTCLCIWSASSNLTDMYSTCKFQWLNFLQLMNALQCLFYCLWKLLHVDWISEPIHWVCKPAYLVSVPSQDEVWGLQHEGHPV